MEQLRSRFADKCSIGDAGCILWTGARTPAGYGKMTYLKQFIYAHHVALLLDDRPRPDGAIALHSCNNPSCVNARHLSWGTQADNMRQAIREGRAPHRGRVAGEKNGNAKLTAHQVEAIRSSDKRLVEIAQEYSISVSLASAIRMRKAWAHI